MKKNIKLKVVFILIAAVVIVALAGRVFATSGGITILNSNGSNNVTNEENNITNEDNNNSNNNNSEYNTYNSIPTDNTSSDTSYDYAGSESNAILFVFMVVAGVSAIYTYKKIKEFNI